MYKIHISNPAPLVHLDSATDHRYQYSSLAPRPSRGGIRAQRGGGEYYILLLILTQMQRDKIEFIRIISKIIFLSIICHDID